MKKIRIFISLLLMVTLVACGSSKPKGTVYDINTVISSGEEFTNENIKGELILEKENFELGDVSNGHVTIKCADAAIDVEGDLVDCEVSNLGDVKDTSGVLRTMYSYNWKLVAENNEEYNIVGVATDVKEEDGLYNKFMLGFDGSQSFGGIYVRKK